MKGLTRRDCIRGALAAGAGMTAAAWGATKGAGNDIRLGIVGLQRRGRQHVELFRGIPGVRVVALCDCDRAFVDAEAAKFARRGAQVATYVDFRKMLDDKGVDAITVATPNHWHALMTVWACQAGKDVYVEKPVSHNIWEGRQMVAAAAKYKRILATGTQNRSDVGLKAAFAWLGEGHIGKLKLARGFDYPRRPSIGKVAGPQPLPATVDYNLFQGPAPLVPLMRRRLHYDWHFVWPTGNGDAGNRGVHTLDMIRWALKQTQANLPRRVVSIAGRYGYDDDATTPNTQVTYFDCKPVPIVWELRSLPRAKGAREMDSFRGVRASIMLEYEGGTFVGGRGGGRVLDKNGKAIKRFPGDSGKGHYANFIEAVRSRKTGDLESDILEGHLSSMLCHMANIPYRVGHRRPTAEVTKAVADNEILSEALGRMVGHLKANEIDLKTQPLTVGPTLTLDAKAERFVGEHSRYANMHLSRNYRRPFAVPEV